MTTPKTSHHSALSELMVQNVELRAENAALKSRLDKTPHEVRVFTPTDRMYMAQLTDPLKSEINRLKAENARLAAEAKELQSFNNDLCADLCAIEDALGLKQDQRNPDGSWKPTREAVKEKLRDLIAATGELGDAKAENARLRSLVEKKP